MSKDKWIMFKNYLHNELGITKEHIEEWVKEAIDKVARDYIDHHLLGYTIENHIKNELSQKRSWGQPELKHEVKALAAKILAEILDIQIVEKERTK